MISLTKEEITARMKTYAEWRKEHNFPRFEPANGICRNCHKQIFNRCDGTKAITGCPFCYKSYCA